MIISCEQCYKKFEIESNLIPKKGRLLMFPPNWCYPHIGEKVFDKPISILVEQEILGV